MSGKRPPCTEADLRVVTTTADAWYPDALGDPEEFAYEVESNQQFHTCVNCGQDFHETVETSDNWRLALDHLKREQLPTNEEVV